MSVAIKNMVICDDNVVYLERFLNVTQDVLEREFSLYVYHTVEEVWSMLQKQEAEIILIAERMCDDRLKRDGRIGHLFVLSDRPGNEQDRICRFQAADSIVRILLQSYANESQMISCEDGSSNQKIHFIGVYTPIGRCLQTTFAITLGQLLAREHKTLYLNFEGFSGLSRIFQTSVQYNMTDLVYFYDCAREKFIYRLEHMVLKSGDLDYVPPFDNYQELASICGEKWREIFSYLEENSDYEYVVLDLSEHMNGLLDVLRYCERIYTITREDGFSLAKMEQYERMLCALHYDDVLEKTSQKRMPVFKHIPAHIEQFTYGDVADYTKNLLQEEWGFLE